MQLEGKCALVTGGSRGIGRGIVLKLAERGAKVAINYVKNESAAEQTLAKVREFGSEGITIRADVSQPEQISAMLEKVAKQFGRLDIFVSNARGEVQTFYQEPMQITLEQWNAAVDSQAKAFLVGARQAAELMPDGGRIIAITYAPGGRFGSWQPWVAMGSGKLAMESLCRYFAVALAPRGITVNALSPGWIEDSVLNTLPEVAQEMIRNWHAEGWTPMGRLGTPADIGNAVLLLCASEASWITGQVIAVDGGAGLMDSALPLALQLGARAQKKTAAPAA